ncbi:MAG: hypothetical protein V1821_04425 [bacterium]
MTKSKIASLICLILAIGGLIGNQSTGFVSPDTDYAKGQSYGTALIYAGALWFFIGAALMKLVNKTIALKTQPDSATPQEAVKATSWLKRLAPIIIFLSLTQVIYYVGITGAKTKGTTIAQKIGQSYQAVIKGQDDGSPYYTVLSQTLNQMRDDVHIRLPNMFELDGIDFTNVENYQSKEALKHIIEVAENANKETDAYKTIMAELENEMRERIQKADFSEAEKEILTGAVVDTEYEEDRDRRITERLEARKGYTTAFLNYCTFLHDNYGLWTAKMNGTSSIPAFTFQNAALESRYDALWEELVSTAINHVETEEKFQAAIQSNLKEANIEVTPEDFERIRDQK